MYYIPLWTFPLLWRQHQLIGKDCNILRTSHIWLFNATRMWHRTSVFVVTLRTLCVVTFNDELGSYFLQSPEYYILCGDIIKWNLRAIQFSEFFAPYTLLAMRVLFSAISAGRQLFQLHLNLYYVHMIPLENWRSKSKQFSQRIQTLKDKIHFCGRVI